MVRHMYSGVVQITCIRDAKQSSPPISEFWFRWFKSFEWCDICSQVWLEFHVFGMPNKVVREPFFRCSNFRFIHHSKFPGASSEDFNAQIPIMVVFTLILIRVQFCLASQFVVGFIKIDFYLSFILTGKYSLCKSIT